jgi:hypothetical protein
MRSHSLARLLYVFVFAAFVQRQVIPLACKMLYSIGPKTGIGFRKARCVDSTTWSVLCASEWTHGALGGMDMNDISAFKALRSEDARAP